MASDNLRDLKRKYDEIREKHRELTVSYRLQNKKINQQKKELQNKENELRNQELVTRSILELAYKKPEVAEGGKKAGAGKKFKGFTRSRHGRDVGPVPLRSRPPLV